jgi:putative ABC transport system permease protein
MFSYRLLLRLFPRGFRDRFGEDMTELFADRLEDARRSGTGAVARLIVRVGADAVAHSLAERRATRRHAGPRDSVVRSVIMDIAYALRLLRRRPGFTAAALLTLTLGVGANVAIFSAVRAVLIDDLPYPEPDRLVHVSLRTAETPDGGTVPRIPAFEFLQASSPMLHAMGAIVPSVRTLSGAGRPEQIRTAEISPAMMEVAALPPVAGRGLALEDYREGTDAVLISEQLWRSRFGRELSAVGRGIRLSGIPKRIVGVMPDRFDLEARHDRRIDLWLPLLWRNGQGSIGSTIVARLPPGADVLSAEREIDRLIPQLPVTLEQRDSILGVSLMPLVERGRDDVRPGLLLLQGAAALFLILACANLGNLLLVQGASRQREIGVRAAIGASRGRLFRQALTEAGVLAAIAGALGVLVAYWTVPALVATASWALPRAGDIGVRWPELGIGLAIATVTSLVAAAVPAWMTTRADVIASLRNTTQLTGQRATRTLRNGLIAVEVALTLTILMSAGLLINSFARVVALPMGFEPRGVVIAEIQLRSRAFATPEARLAAVNRLHGDLVDRLGVRLIAVANSMPYTSSLIGPATQLSPEGRYERLGNAVYRIVTPEYFETLRIPLVRGRNFTAADAAGSDRVVIVNEEFVRQYGPAGEIIGARMKLGPRETIVVGVAGDTRNTDVTAPLAAVVHWPLEQRPVTDVTFAIRGAPSAAVANAIQSALAPVDPDLAARIDTLESRMRHGQAQRRFYLLIFSLLAGLGAGLSAVGIYGVTTHVVGLRARELAVRRALGSTHGQVHALVVRQGLIPVAFGLSVGLVGAWWATEWLGTHSTFSSQLFQITGHDLTTFTATGAAVLSLAALACWIPARRASRVNPMTVLRTE